MMGHWLLGVKTKKYSVNVALGLVIIIILLMLMMIEFLLCLDKVFVIETSLKTVLSPREQRPHQTLNPACYYTY